MITIYLLVILNKKIWNQLLINHSLFLKLALIIKKIKKAKTKINIIKINRMFISPMLPIIQKLPKGFINNPLKNIKIKFKMPSLLISLSVPFLKLLKQVKPLFLSLPSMVIPLLSNLLIAFKKSILINSGPMI